MTSHRRKRFQRAGWASPNGFDWPSVISVGTVVSLRPSGQLAVVLAVINCGSGAPFYELHVTCFPTGEIGIWEPWAVDIVRKQKVIAEVRQLLDMVDDPRGSHAE